ncbi:hypothetical protein [Acinetobacter sp.]|uniref:hypothetical protein n=1 Tax=Acinetobacter sp. TaxID=472 RepID=UPI00388D7D7F
MMLNRQKINNMLSMLIHEFQILDGYDLGIFFKDDSGNNNYRAIYLWIEELMDQNPEISFDEVSNKFKKQIPESCFNRLLS